MTDLRAEELWPYVSTMLPESLDELAERTGALRRCRGVKDATSLLRIILTYAVTDMSLKDVAAWARGAGVGRLTGPGLFYRLRQAESWLSATLAETLKHNVPCASGKLRVRVVDATHVVGPGAKGTEWRVHGDCDPATGCLCSVVATDASLGESCDRHPVSPGDVILGDRIYGLAPSIASVSERGGYVVVRANLYAIRLCRPTGEVFSPLSESERVPNVGVAAWDVLIPAPPRERSKSHKTWKLSEASAWVPARLLAARTMEGEIIWILTTLPAALASDEEVMKLYGFRWQIELLFKRLKSLLHIDAMPSRQGPTARSESGHDRLGRSEPARTGPESGGVLTSAGCARPAHRGRVCRPRLGCLAHVGDRRAVGVGGRGGGGGPGAGPALLQSVPEVVLHGPQRPDRLADRAAFGRTHRAACPRGSEIGPLPAFKLPRRLRAYPL